MPINSQKTRFKMYKAGKLWFTMGTTFLSVAALNTVIVSADEQQADRNNTTEIVVNKQVTDETMTTSEAKDSTVKDKTDEAIESKSETVSSNVTEGVDKTDEAIESKSETVSSNVTEGVDKTNEVPAVDAKESTQLEDKSATNETDKAQENKTEQSNSEPETKATNGDEKDVPVKKADNTEPTPKAVEKPATKTISPKANTTQKAATKQSTVSDPDYPQNMWLDKDENHYNFQQLVNRRGTQQIVFSTNRNGDGTVYVFEINSATQQVIRSYVLQRGSNVRLSNGAIVYNDEQYSGLFQSAGSNESWARGYSLGAYNPRDFFTNISYFVPELIEQTVSYVDEKGNNIVDTNGQVIKPEVQQGLTGQKYTTSEPKFIKGYYNEHYLEMPENAQGTMSQFGKVGAKYERNFHDGSYIIFTQLDEHGTMQADVYENGIKQATYTVPAGDSSQRYSRKYGRGTITIANPYVAQTRNVVYRYKLLGSLVPDVPGSKPVPYPNNPADNTKPGNPIIPDIPGYTPVDPDGNPLTPGEPYPVNPSKPGEDTPLHYEANEQKAQVEFIDQNTGKVIKVTELTGKTDAKSDYRTKDQISELEAQGYEFVSDNYPIDGVIFDGDASTTQSFQVVMKHKTKTVTPTEPGKPGEPIDPSDPDGPKYPNGTEKSQLTRDIERTIKYVDKNGKTVSKSVKDSITVSREATFDVVTGEVTYGEWQFQSNAFDAIKSPIIEGMYADKSVVEGSEINADTQSIEEVVTYYPLGNLVPDVPGTTPVPYPNDETDAGKPGNPIIPDVPGFTPVDPDGKPLTPGEPYPVYPSKPGEDTELHYEANDQQAQVEFFDQDTGKTIKVDRLNGKTGSKSNYRTKDQIAELEAKGYELVSDNYPTDGVVFDNNDDIQQNFRVVLKHKTKTITPTEPGKPGEPIDPSNPDGPKYPDGSDLKSLQKVIDRTIKYVDNKGNVVSDTVKESVTFEREATFDLVTGEITYTEWQTTNGKFKGVKSPIVEDFFADKSEIVEKNVTVDEESSEETVTYYPLGNLVPDVPGTTPVPYPNDETDAGKPGNPIIPDIPGFTPVDPDGNTLTPGEPYPVDPSKPGKDTEIHYEANEQQAQVEFFDQDTGKTIKVDRLNGKTGSKSDYRTKDQIAELEAKGYELVSDNYPNEGVVFDNDDKKSQNFRVILKHKTKTVTPTEPGKPGEPVDPSNPDGPKYPNGTDVNALHREINRNIKYVDTVHREEERSARKGRSAVRNDRPLGPQISDPVTQRVSFDRQATIDLVTGEVTYTEWTTDNAIMGAVKSPIIEGRFADRPMVTEQQVNPDDGDIDEVVMYFPLGNLVPDVPGSTPIPYPNDETDATKPGNPIIPDIPGFTPVDPDGKPLTPGEPYPVDPTKPGEDTELHYEANDQQAQVEFFDQDTGKTIKVESLTGKPGAKSDYRTKDQIAELEAKGYEVVSDNYPTDGVVFDNDDKKSQNFRVILKHKTKTVTPTDPGKPGQPIDPTNPDGQKYPNGTDVNSLHREIKRNIKYVDTVRREETRSAKKGIDTARNDRPLGPQLSNPVTQSVSFDRQATIDMVTGEVTYTEWSTENSVMGEVQSPVIEGRFADRPMVTELQVNPDDSDIDEMVMYFPLGNLVPDVPGSTPVPYPNDETDATKPGNPIIPDIPGFTPVDPDGKPLTPGDPYPVDPNKPGDDTSIHYEANEQQAQVEFIDQKTGKVIRVKELKGQTNTKSDYRTADDIKQLELLGYELVTDNYPSDGIVFDADGSVTQSFQVLLKHKTKTVTPTEPGKPGEPIDPSNPDGPKYPKGTEETQLKREIKRTIKYVDRNGKTVADNVTESIIFTRDATFDLVTGEITYGDWQVQKSVFDTVESPIIDGMIADKLIVPGTDVNADSQDVDVIVTYSAVDQVVPEKPDTKPNENKTEKPNKENQMEPLALKKDDVKPEVSDVSEDALPETGTNQNEHITHVGLALLGGLLSFFGFAKIRKYFK